MKLHKPMGLKPSVLVLDGDMVPSLTIARSLARLQLHVVVASHLPQPLASYSRAAAACVFYPDPLAESIAFVTWCREQLATERYRLIIPVTERTLIPLMALAHEPHGARLAMAAPAALQVALFKAQTLALAEQLGISVPRSRLVEPGSADMTAHYLELQLPIVIKPARSIGEQGVVRKQLQVRYAFDIETVNVQLKQYLPYGPVLLQEYVSGQGVGIELLVNHGQIIYAFQHVRLHEVPLTGGGSSLRMSVAIEPVLLDAAQALMHALQWHGIAMVEFKWQPDTRTFALMEINGRFWGSLPLAVAAGADFPAMLYELLTTGHITARTTTLGIICRKLDRDIQWYEQVLRHDAPPQLIQLPSFHTLLKDTLLVFSPRHRFDIQCWRDPLPGIVDVGRILADYVHRALQLWQYRTGLKQQRRAWRSGRVPQLLAQAQQILFVCYGNINRSAFAERYYALLMPNTQRRIRSAGFHSVARRPADPMMIEVAQTVDVDMTGWSSVAIDASLVAASDVIFVMEYRHYTQLMALFPAARHKTFLLGMAGDPVHRGNEEIADPFGQTRRQYEGCVQALMVSIRQLIPLLNTTHVK